MPQNLVTNTQKIVISYTITTTDSNNVSETITVTDKAIDLNLFDKTDFDEEPEKNNATAESARIMKWFPGYHYIYYLTIDANAIQFTAEIADWKTVNGYYYLAN